MKPVKPIEYLRKIYSSINFNNFYSPKIERHLSTLCLLILILLIVIYTLKKSLFFTSIPIDGAFQHLNPMRRIADGQLPGRDIQVFHGLIVSYLHYPIFSALGKTLFASEFSRYLLNGLFAVTSVLLIFGGLVKKSRAILYSAIFLIVGKFLGVFWLIDPFGDAYSSLAVRTFAPTIAFAYLLYLNRKNRLRTDRFFIRVVIPCSVIVAIAAAIATEQGLALGGAIGVYFLIGTSWRSIKDKILDLLAYILVSLATFTLIIIIASAGSPGNFLKFAFVYLPSDQFWYFGSYPNIFAKNFWSLIFVPGTRYPFPHYLIALVALALIAIRSVWSKVHSERPKRHDETILLCIAMLYGCAALISNLGMVSAHYAEPLTRISLIIIIFYSMGSVLKWRAHQESQGIVNYAFISVSLVLLFSSDTFLGALPASYSFAKEYLTRRAEQRISGVIPSTYEYDDFLSKTSYAIPPKEIFQKDSISSGKIFLFLNPPPELYRHLSIGDKITLNGKQEKVLQVSKTHIASSYQPGATIFELEYSLGNPKTLASTPFYRVFENREWSNGISKDPSGGCILVPKAESLVGVTSGRELKFSFESKPRQITNVLRNIICVDGSPLEPYEHGFPERFTITNKLHYTLFPYSSPLAFSELKKLRVEAYHFESGLAYLGGKSNHPWPDTGINFYNELSVPSCLSTQSLNLWSTYTGLLDLVIGTKNPGNVDYMIHALGKTMRQKYLDDFEHTQPKFVQTLRAGYTPYERWLQTSTWNFYHKIIDNYHIAATTNHSLIWERNTSLSSDASWNNWPEQLCNTSDKNWITTDTAWTELDKNSIGPKSISLRQLIPKHDENTPQKFYEIDVSYKAFNKFEKFPMVGKSARFFLKPVGSNTALPISLPPYENHIVFPLEASNSGDLRLDIETISLLGGVHLEVNSVKYREIPYSDDVKDLLLDENYK